MRLDHLLLGSCKTAFKSIAVRTAQETVYLFNSQNTNKEPCVLNYLSISFKQTRLPVTRQVFFLLKNTEVIRNKPKDRAERQNMSVSGSTFLSFGEGRY